MRLRSQMRKPKIRQKEWEKSYQEILHILTLMERDDLKPAVYRGQRLSFRQKPEPGSFRSGKDLAKEQ